MPLEVPAITVRTPEVGGHDATFRSGLDSTSSSGSRSQFDSDTAEDEEELEDARSLGGRRSSPSCRDCRDLRRFVWEFMNHDASLPTWMWWMSIGYQLGLAVLVVALFIVDNTGGAREAAAITTLPYWVAEMVLTVIWSIEYLLRIWSCVEQDPQRLKGDECQARRRLLVQPLVLIDLFSITSLVVDMCIKSNEYRGISSLRLLTVFRIEREFNLFGPVLMVIQSKGPMLIATLGIAGVVLLIGSVTMFYIESPNNEDFSSVLSSMWWCTTALTTVGYGDIYPRTGLGRLVGSIVAFLGIGLFAMPAGIIASGFQEMWEETRIMNRKQRHKARAGTAASRSGASGATAAAVAAAGGSQLVVQHVPLDTLRRLEMRQEIIASRLDSIAAEMAELRAELRLALSSLKKPD